MFQLSPCDIILGPSWGHSRALRAWTPSRTSRLQAPRSVIHSASRDGEREAGGGKLKEETDKRKRGGGEKGKKPLKTSEGVAQQKPPERDRAGAEMGHHPGSLLPSDAHRERSAPRSDVDGVLLFADTFQAGQCRLLRTFASSSNASLPTTPIRSACVRSTPTRPSGLCRFLLLPPLQGNAQGQVLGEMIHCGIPSSLHVPGGGGGKSP